MKFASSNLVNSVHLSQAQAETMDIPVETASYLLSVVGVANTIGRLLLGYISDKPWVNRLYVYNISLGVCGIGE